MTEEFVNNSGQGAQGALPLGLEGFNWGACFLGWIWGIGNQSYITLVQFATIITSFIPIIGQIIPLGFMIWFGIKGNEWAWQNKHWESVEHFQRTQKTWAAWGIGFFVVGIVLAIWGFVLLGAAAVLGGAQ